MNSKSKIVSQLICLHVFFLLTNVTYAQLCISTGQEQLIIGIENPINITYSQDKPIEVVDIKVGFKSYHAKRYRGIEVIEKNGYFYIKPDSIGIIELSVKTKDGVKKKVMQTITLKAVGRLSSYGANYEGKIGVGRFKAQVGLTAQVIDYNICANCKVLEFEMIRISKSGEIERVVNRGAKFTKETKKTIGRTQPEDLFIFRKIWYKCPGDIEPKRLDDMIFEIE